MRKGVISVGALDNTDHNPSTTTAQGSFYGISISIFLYPTETNPGLIWEPFTIFREDNEPNVQQKSLPDRYRIVPAVNCNPDTAIVFPPATTVPKDVSGNLEAVKQQESNWLTHSSLLIKKETLGNDAKLAWGAYQASRNLDKNTVPGISSLLPLFHEKAATIAMVKHGMTIICDTTTFCNPGQIPIMAVDQPLLALAKHVQWK